MSQMLRASWVELAADTDPSKRWKSRWLEVFDPSVPLTGSLISKRCVAKYALMCQSISSDIQTVDGSGETVLAELRRIERGETGQIEVDGNAWVTHITPSKVWFEGLYSQGTGGEVTFAQYKLAVETYVRFLADPERRPIEVPFPES